MKTNVGEVAEKVEFLYIARGNIKWYSHYGKEYGNPSENLNRITIKSSNFTSKYTYSKELIVESQTDNYMFIFIRGLFKIVAVESTQFSHL